MDKPLPVVIIPGYYGTLLVDKAANDRTVWLTLGGMFKSGEVLDAINLETGDPDRIAAGGILEEFDIIGRWAPNFYKDLRMFLGRRGLKPEEIIAFGVDWRRTLGFNVDQLHAKLSRIGKVNIVAHSHGGLVAREYLHKHGPNLVEHLITFGTPHKGMLDTFEALVDGSDFFKWSKSHVLKTARTFPSAYELLPADPADGMFVWNRRRSDPFANAEWADAAMRPKLLAAADVVTNLPRRLPVKTVIVYGTHRDTLVRATGAPGRKLRFVEEPGGDGTVPTVSASGSGLTGESHSIERYAIPYGIHSHLFDHDAAKTIMTNVLFNRPTPHFAFSFARDMYLAGEPLGVGVDLRGPHGEVLADAEVSIRINGREIPLPRDEASGDYFAELTMPAAPQHLQYKVTARSASAGASFTKIGILPALNA